MSQEHETAIIEKQWAGRRPLAWNRARILGRPTVVRLRGSVPIELHARAPGRGTSVEGPRHRALRACARRGHRQPGRADGQGRTAVHLSVRVAGGSGRQQRGSDVSGPESVPRQQRTRSDSQDQRRPGAGPIRSTMRRETIPSTWFLPIVADAEAGFGGVLNAFRADEGHDRRRRGRACISKTSSRRRRSAATWAARYCFRPGSRSRS